MDELTERLAANFHRDPGNTDAFKALSEHLFFKGHWKDYVDVCSRRAKILEDTLEAARLFAKAASIAEDKLRELDRAESLYRSALDLETEFRPALLGLRQVLERQGKFEDLVEVMATEARLASAMERPLLFMQAGRTLESRVGDIPKAIEFYRQALELQPNNVKVIDALEKSFRALDRWEDVRELLEGVVASNPSPDLHARVLFKLGKVYETHFSDPVRATRCLEMVLELKPGVASVYRDLARLYRSQKTWGALIRILEAEAKLDLPPAERARCLKTAGEISVERLGDTEAATRFFTRAAELAPDFDDDLEEEGPKPQEDEALARLKVEIDEAIGPADQVDRILEVVRHLVTEGRDTAEAATWIGKALSLQPEGLERWREILACAADCEEGRRATEALEAHVKTLESGEEAAAFMVLLGEFLVDQLRDRTGAIQAFQKALQRNPQDQSAVAHLEKHWEEMGHVEGLTSLFRWQAAKAPDGETRTRARQKLTRVLTRDPARVDEATALLEATILENPSDAGAVDEYVRLMSSSGEKEAVLATLNRAHQKDPSATGIRLHLAKTLLSLDRTREAAEGLEGLYRENPTDPELWKMLVDVLEALEDYDRMAGLKAESIRGIGNFEEKLKALLELGALYRDKVQSLPEAVATFEDALAIDPANEDALAALERIHSESERWSELVEVLERRAAFALDTDNSSEIYLRIGDVWAEKLGDLSTAASALEKASALDPQNPALLLKLEETYTGLQDGPGLLRILRKIRETTSDPEEAVRCLAKIAEVHEKDLGDGEKALKYYREVLDVRPDHVPALKGVQRICKEAGDDPGRAEALLREAAVTQAPDQRGRLFREGGLLLLASDVDAAEKALREALALDPGDMENIEALERVYESRGDWGRFVEMALLRVDRLEGGKEKDALTLKVARVLEELGRREEALALFSSVLKASPDSMEALGGVRRIAEQTHSHQEAAEALRREIQLAEAHEVAGLHQRLGEILENRLHDLPGALDAFRNAAKTRPEGPDLTPDLERVMLKLGREEDVVHWLEEKAGRVQEETRSEFLTRAGLLARERLFDDERAIQDLSDAVEAYPGNREARGALKPLLTRHRRWPELVPLLEMEAVSGPEAERTAVYLELGQVCERHTNDGETAARCYRQVLSRDTGNRVARGSLARVLRRLGDHEGLAEVLEEEFEQLDEDRDRAGRAVELGNLHQGPLEDPETAIAWFEKALSIRPGHSAALGALDRLYESQEMWSELVRIWESTLRSEASDTQKKAVCVRLGRLYEEEFSNLKMALKCYKSALSFDPDSLGALRGIQRVARAAKNLDACRKAFEKEIGLGGEPARLALLHQGVGIILEKEKKSAEALSHFEKASRLAPGNREILRDLIQLYEKQEKHVELADAFERWAALAPTGVEKAETLLACARVADDHLKDSKRALDLLTRANAADSKNPEVLQVLGNQFFARGDHQAVVDLLHQEIELVSDPDKKSRLLLRAAQIHEDPLGDVFKAAECLHEAVRLNPEGGKGLRALRELQGRFGGDVPREGGDADPIPALLAEAKKLRESSPERAMAMTLNVLDQDPLNGEALEGLVRLLSEKGEHRRAAVWLSMLAGSEAWEETEGAEAKPSVFLRLGRLIEEQLQDPGRAVEAYFRAWELAPGLSDVADAVLRLAPEAGRWEEYVKVREASARDAESEEKGALYLELATIEEEDLGNTLRAAEWVRAAMEESPRDDTVLSAAVRLFERTGDKEGLARALAGLFEASSIQGTATAEEAARIARLHLRELHDPEVASGWFARAVELDAGDPALLEESRQAHLQAGRNREADRLFLLEIEATPDPGAAASLHHERARFLSRDLGDEGEALRSLREAARHAPGDFTILSEMEILARRSGRWLDLAKILEEMARHSGVEEEKADLYAQAGDLYWERLSDFPASRRSYAEALKRKSDISKARERMGGDA